MTKGKKKTKEKKEETKDKSFSEQMAEVEKINPEFVKYLKSKKRERK